MKDKNKKYTEADLNLEIKRFNRIHTALIVSAMIVILMLAGYAGAITEFAQIIGKKMAFIVTGVFVAIMVVLVVFIRIIEEKLNSRYGASMLLNIANNLKKDEQKEDME